MPNGTKEGLKKSNKVNRKVTSLITPTQLKKEYLFGVDLTDDAGNEISNSTLQSYIDNATSMLEHFLDISITPVMGEIEEKDYNFNEYFEWGFFQINSYPVQKITSIELTYFRDENGDPDVLVTIPNNWVRLDNHSGIIRLIPNAKFPANLQISALGNYFPEILKTDKVPNLWRITYDHGFADGCIPVAINDAIARLASIQALTTAGFLVIGAGIGSQSLSIDGLSQSISTTQSAENSIFSGNILDHKRVLFGERKDDPSALLSILKSYYKGMEMYMI